MKQKEYNNETTITTFDSCIWEANLSNHSVQFLSSTPEKIFGISQEQFVEKPYLWREQVHPDDMQFVKNNQKKLYSGSPIMHEYRIIRPDGKIRWLMNQTFPKKDHQGQITHLLGITFDITNIKNYEYQLKTTNNELRDITNALHLTADVTITDTNGTITYANDKFCEISKYTREELIGQNHRLIHSGYHSKEVYQELWDTIAQGQVWNNEIKNKAKDGTYFWSDSTIVPFLNEDGVPYQYIAIRKDITAKKENEELIRKLAFEDILTQLPNIRSLETHLNKLCQNKEKKFAVLLIGLDHFRSINDHYGMKTGDQVLVEVSKRLAQIAKEQSGFIFRCNGDEFCILLEGIKSINQVTRLAEQILEIINRPLQIKGQILYITTTIGISFFPTDASEGGTLLEKADLALNKGRTSGKNRYYLFTNVMDIESFKYFTLRNDLNIAMEQEEFFIQYQPKVNLSTNQVIGAEALVRWEHPKWGTVPPIEFISIAEDTGLIIKLGEWIFNRVCMQIHEWNQMGLRKIPISINFSPLQFLDPLLIDMILNTINKSDIDPNYVEIEITENFILENYDEVIKQMTLLRKKGISFSIDDFGTGYSSLKTLKKLHFDYLKIDRSFIKDLHYSQESLQITKAMIQLAHTLDMKVVAEGVDDSRQVTILKEQNCDYIQGYSFSEPVHAKEFEKFLKNSKYEPENDHKKTIQANINRRQYFRILFKYPLLGSMTVQVVNNKPVQIGSSSILIEDLGAGGLCYQSNIKFPLNKGFILEIKTTILDHNLSFVGRNVWCKEIDNQLYQYGFEFDIEESERTHILPLLNQLQVKYRKEMLLPNCSFVKLTNPSEFFKNGYSANKSK